MDNLLTLQYPIGRYSKPKEIRPSQIKDWITQIEKLPGLIKETASEMRPEQLSLPYRPGGWTGRQVIHHLPDSHMNAYIRFKLALTEENPSIKPYFEDRFANLPDYQMDIDTSIDLLSNIHRRWVYLLTHLSESDWSKTFMHPEYKTISRLDETLGNYAWHGNHHLHHLKLIIKNGPG